MNILSVRLFDETYIWEKEQWQILDIVKWIKKKISHSKNPDSVLFYNLGIIYKSLFQDNKAIEAFKQALKINPAMRIAWFKLGLIYEGMENFDKAIEAFKHLVQLDPQDKHSWYDLGISYQFNYQFEKAIWAFKKALKIDPAYNIGLFNLGNLYKKLGKSEKAEEMYLKMNEPPCIAILWHREPHRSFDK